MNGGVDVELTGPLGSTGSVSLEAVNGGVSLALPDGSQASVTARVTNGGINTTGLDFSVDRRADPATLRRHAERGRRAVTLQTTNGGVRECRNPPPKRLKLGAGDATPDSVNEDKSSRYHRLRRRADLGGTALAGFAAAGPGRFGRRRPPARGVPVPHLVRVTGGPRRRRGRRVDDGHGADAAAGRRVPLLVVPGLRARASLRSLDAIGARTGWPTS